MYIDKELELSDSQAVTTTDVSDNIIDFGDNSDRGPGEDLILFIQVDTTATAAGAATVTVDLETDSDSGFGSATVALSSGAIGKADLSAGASFQYRLPAKGLKRYLRINYTVGTGPLTAGAFSAFIVKDAQSNKNSF